MLITTISNRKHLKDLKNYINELKKETSAYVGYFDAAMTTIADKYHQEYLSLPVAMREKAVLFFAAVHFKRDQPYRF